MPTQCVQSERGITGGAEVGDVLNSDADIKLPFL